MSKEDSLEHTNDCINHYLKKVYETDKRAINYKLPHATDTGLSTILSDDKKLRVCSWDTRLGGTMRRYYDFVAYTSSKGVKAKCFNCNSEDDYGYDLRDVVTIHTNAGKTIYLISGYSVISTKDRAENIDAYIIEKNSLKKVNVFETDKQQLNSIGYGYDIFASVKDGKDLPAIHLSKDNKKLYIPVVDGEKLTNKYLIYTFNGNNYVFDKNSK